MKHRENILPAWLQDAGYRTALIGKWLNGYGARDAHGEVPTGLRHLARPARRLRLRLLQLRHEPRRQAAQPGATPSSPRKLVEFANIEVIAEPAVARSRSSPSSRRSSARRPYSYWGTENAEGLLARRHRRDHRRSWSRPSAKSKKPFFIWWSPAAPHREDVATTLMGRPGPDPRPPPRYADAAARATRCRGRRASTRRTSPTSPRTCSDEGAAADRGADRPAAARLRGPGRLAARGRRPRRQAGRDPARRPTS